MTFVPEAVPAAGFGLAALESSLAWIFAAGALVAWGATFGKLAVWLAHEIHWNGKVLGHRVAPDIPRLILTGNNAVVAWLQAMRTGAEIELAYTLRHFQEYSDLVAASEAFIAHETAQTFDWLVGVKLPRWAKWAAAAAVPVGLLTKLVTSAIEHLHTIIRKVVHTTVTATTTVVYKYPRAIERRLEADEARLEAIAKNVATLTGSVALPLPPLVIPHAVQDLQNLSHKVWRRIRSISREQIMTASLMAAALANVWGVSTRCARSGGPLGRAARALCGLDNAVLDFMLAGVLEAAVVTDLCGMVEGLNAVALQLEPALIELVKVEGALVGCPSASYPEDLKLAAYNPTPVVAALAV
jgi:hypothetical protein